MPQHLAMGCCVSWYVLETGTYLILPVQGICQAMVVRDRGQQMHDMLRVFRYHGIVYFLWRKGS